MVSQAQIEEKIRKEVTTFLLRGSIFEKIDKIEFFHNQEESLGLALVDKKGGWWAVRLLKYDKRTDKVSRIVSEDVIFWKSRALKKMEEIKKSLGDQVYIGYIEHTTINY